MKKKKILSVLLCLALVFVMAAPASAQGSSGEKIVCQNVNGVEVTVVIPSNLVGCFNDRDIQGLLEGSELQNGDIITICEVGNVKEEENIQPYWGETIQTEKSSGPEWNAQNYFLISVAKGLTTTLSKKFSATLSTEISAGTALDKAQIGGSVTAEYSVTYQFSGPPETSNYNSREFRVQFYAVDVNWTQRKIDRSGNIIETRSGTAKVPTRYAMYSIDRVVGV